MLVTYFRSSSYGAWDFCNQQYAFSYLLGMKPDAENGWAVPKPQHKADKGTVAHKALELLAARKLAEQEGRDEVLDPETGYAGRASDLTPETCIELAWDHYSRKCDYHEWTTYDFRDCRDWVLKALAFRDGLFSPLKRHVIWPEKHFDFELEGPRFRYDFPDPRTPGARVVGQLSLKGTIDLVVRGDDSGRTVELVDWKTGKRKDWAKDKVKEFGDLCDDAQLRIYHYALSRLCPDAEHIVLTIFFINDGGPFSIPFSRADLKRTEDLLHARFREIAECRVPPLIFPNFKCEKMCAFGMNRWENGEKTVCRHLADEVIQLGIDRVTAKYAKNDAWLKYQDGGGQSERGNKEWPSE